MINFLENLSSKAYTGLAGFLAFVVFIIMFYKMATTELERNSHKIFLQESLDVISRFNLKIIGKKSAIVITNTINNIFSKPKNYNIKDYVFWNYRVLIFFVLISITFMMVSIISWNNENFKSYLIIYPILIMAVSIVQSYLANKARMLKEVIENGGGNRDEISIKYNNKYDVISLFSATFYYIFLSTLMFSFFSMVFYKNEGSFLEKYNIILIYPYYMVYILFGLISFYFSRVLLYKLSKTAGLMNSIIITLAGLFLASLILYMATIIATNIQTLMLYNMKNHLFIETSDINHYLFDWHKYILVGVVILPLLLFFLLLSFELVVRLIVSPTKYIITILFEKIINRNELYIMFSAILIALLIIYSLEYVEFLI